MLLVNQDLVTSFGVCSGPLASSLTRARRGWPDGLASFRGYNPADSQCKEEVITSDDLSTEEAVTRDKATTMKTAGGVKYLPAQYAVPDERREQ